MSLQTESGLDLLTESGLPLLAEGESSGGGGDTVTLHGKPVLSLTAAVGTLTVETRLILLTAHATLNLTAQGAIQTGLILLSKRPGRDAHWLALTVRQGQIQPPEALGAAMQITTDRQGLILDQYLRVWACGHPSAFRLTVQVDDEPVLTPDFTWQNPGHTAPALLKIAATAIPGDGFTHRLTIRTWHDINGAVSEAAVATLYTQTPRLTPTDTPEWCSAEVVRQTTSKLGDLVRIQWRHDGAVRIMARYQKRKTFPGTLSWVEETLGYGDYDETEGWVEDLGAKVWDMVPGKLRKVWIGVAAMHGGRFGPIRWATEPVQVKERQDGYSWAGEGFTYPPDQLTKRECLWEEAQVELLNELGYRISATRSTIAQAALNQALRKIKDIIRKGGQVTLDNLGVFAARWNASRTTRSVSFTASAGFQEGTRLGRILTDAEAPP